MYGYNNAYSHQPQQGPSYIVPMQHFSQQISNQQAMQKQEQTKARCADIEAQVSAREERALVQLQRVDRLFKSHDASNLRSFYMSWCLFVACVIYLINIIVLKTNKNWCAAEWVNLADKETTVVVVMILTIVLSVFHLGGAIMVTFAMPSFCELKQRFQSSTMTITDLASLKKVYNPHKEIGCSQSIQRSLFWTSVGVLLMQTILVFFSAANAVFHNNGQSMRHFVGVRDTPSSVLPDIKLEKRYITCLIMSIIIMLVGTVLGMMSVQQS